jgi:hypothetical protein
MDKSIAHQSGIDAMNWFGVSRYEDGLVPWSPAMAPDLEAPYSPSGPSRHTGRLRGCDYCGSMHPADLAQALREGAKLSWADRKYGWPHKVYVDNIPNPHAGMLESRSFGGRSSDTAPPHEGWVRYQCGFDSRTGEPEYSWREPGRPAPAKTYGKFYTSHLKDASPEDRKVIECAMGMEFNFDHAKGVAWRPYGSDLQWPA